MGIVCADRRVLVVFESTKHSLLAVLIPVAGDVIADVGAVLWDKVLVLIEVRENLREIALGLEFLLYASH